MPLRSVRPFIFVTSANFCKKASTVLVGTALFLSFLRDFDHILRTNNK